MPCAGSFISQGLGINLPAARNLFTCTCKYDKHTGNSTRYHPLPGLAKGQEQFVLMLRSWGKLSQLGSSWNTTGTGICQITYWNIIAVCRKWYYVYLPAEPLSPYHSPLSLPLFIEVAKCEFDNFCNNATDWGHLALEIAFKLFCQLRQCGGDFGSERSGDLETHWLTGLASLALASVICVQFAVMRRLEIEKKLLVSSACVASSGNGDYSHNCWPRQIIDYMRKQPGKAKKPV